MLIGVIADDFTGASDIANTLAKGGGGSHGLATTQFLGIPSAPASAACEAGVVALKSRSIAADQAIAQSLPRSTGSWSRAAARSSSNIARPSIPRRKAISARSGKRWPVLSEPVA